MVLDRRQSLLAAQGQIFRIPAVDYDGSSDYLTPAEAGNPKIQGTTQTGLISFWFRLDGDDGATVRIASGASLIGQSMIILRNTSNKFSFSWAPGIGDANSFLSTSSFTANSNWRHLMASWDGSTAQHLYIDGIDELNSVVSTGVFSPVYVDNLLHSSGVNLWNGGISQFYMTDEYLDLSVSGNRDKLYDSAGATFVDLGDDASSVTGTQPLIYLDGNYTDAGKNSGSKLDMTVTGTPSNTYAPPT